MKIKTTANIEIVFDPEMRGLTIAEFTDGGGEPCSIQESSGAPVDSDEAWIWFGCDRNAKPHHVTGDEGKPRMFLSQSDVRELLPILQQFAETGFLLKGKSAGVK